MVLCLRQIEQSVNAMDEMYDANFKEWIKDENNCKIIGSVLKKYIGEYTVADFITVVKWIVKEWTLKSIILFSKKLIMDEITEQRGMAYTERIYLVSGFIYTWNPVFISEFLVVATANLSIEDRIRTMNEILNFFEFKKWMEILSELDGKIPKNIYNIISERSSSEPSKHSMEFRGDPNLATAFRLV